MKIAIIGGGGYLGSKLTGYLHRRGHKIFIYDTFWFYNGDVLQFKKECGHVKCTVGDIRSKGLISKFFNQDYDCVINLACLSNDPSCDLNYRKTHEINYEGVLNVIDYADDAFVPKFIHFSSSSVYGVKSTSEIITEKTICEPTTQYAQLKLQIDNYLIYKNHYKSFPCVILRPATICGTSPRQRLDVLPNLFVHQAIKYGKLTLFNKYQYRPLIHINDVIRAVNVLINVEEPANLIYNLGYDNFTIGEIAHLVGSSIPAEIEIVEAPSNDDRSYRICSDEFINEFDFKFNYDIKQAIQDLYIKLSGKFEDSNQNFNTKLMKTIL